MIDEKNFKSILKLFLLTVIFFALVSYYLVYCKKVSSIVEGKKRKKNKRKNKRKNKNFLNFLKKIKKKIKEAKRRAAAQAALHAERIKRSAEAAAAKAAAAAAAAAAKMKAAQEAAAELALKQAAAARIKEAQEELKRAEQRRKEAERKRKEEAERKRKEEEERKRREEEARKQRELEERLKRNNDIQEGIRSKLNQGTRGTNIGNCAVPYTDKLQLGKNSSLFNIFGNNDILKCNSSSQLPEFIPAKTEELHPNGMSLINVGQGDDYITFGDKVRICDSEYKITGKQDNTKVKYGDNVDFESLKSNRPSFSATVNPNVYGLSNVKNLSASDFSKIYKTSYSFCGNSSNTSEVAAV